MAQQQQPSAACLGIDALIQSRVLRNWNFMRHVKPKSFPYVTTVHCWKTVKIFIIQSIRILCRTYSVLKYTLLCFFSLNTVYYAWAIIQDYKIPGTSIHVNWLVIAYLGVALSLQHWSECTIWRIRFLRVCDAKMTGTEKSHIKTFLFFDLETAGLGGYG